MKISTQPMPRNFARATAFYCLLALVAAFAAVFLSSSIANSEAVEAAATNAKPSDRSLVFERRTFGSCITCHGSGLKGNFATRAPALNQLPSWYVRRQLESFTSDYRGKGDSDHYSVAMYRMANSLDPGTLDDAAAFVESWHISDKPTMFTTPGNLDNADQSDFLAGKGLYDTKCADCHGARGEGNEHVSAPPLAALAPWYIEKQVDKFRSGLRGADEADIYGQIMVGAATDLSSEDMSALNAYLSAVIDKN